jgi:putative hydrolase of the HAD superfamily
VQVETLFLDAGGVLVFPNWERVGAALARRGVNVHVTALMAADALAKRDIDVGVTVASTNDQQRGRRYFDLVLKHAGISLTSLTEAALAELRAYHAEHNLWETVPSEVPWALGRLRALGLRLVVVSNANGTLRSVFERLGLEARVDVLVDSHDEGVEKPDPRLFRIALERAGGRAETTMHVGDMYHVDIVGARAAGLRAVLVDATGLYEHCDCPRVRNLIELADRLEVEGF